MKYQLEKELTKHARTGRQSQFLSHSFSWYERDNDRDLEAQSAVVKHRKDDKSQWKSQMRGTKTGFW